MSFIQPLDMTQSAASAKTGAQTDLLAKKAKGLAGENDAQKDEKIWKVACGFEEIFIHMMLKQMRKTTWDNGFMGGGNEAKMYKDMFDSEVAALSAKSKDMGLSRMIHDYLDDRINGTTGKTGNSGEMPQKTALTTQAEAAARKYEKVANTANKRSFE